jgi:hypothetical protein
MGAEEFFAVLAVADLFVDPAVEVVNGREAVKGPFGRSARLEPAAKARQPGEFRPPGGMGADLLSLQFFTGATHRGLAEAR